MHKVTLLTLGLVAVLSSCSQRFDDSSLIRFDFKRISDVAPVDMTSQIVPERLSFQQGRCFTRDTLFFSFLESSSQYVLSVADVRTDSLIGTFCPKGRSEDEPLDVIPFIDLFEEDGSIKSLFFSYLNNRFFMWDISGSLREGRTLYDRVIPIKGEEKNGFLPAVSYYYLPGERIILQNTRQTISDWMVEPPTYDVYSVETGECERVFSPFALYEGEETLGEDGLFGSKVYLSLDDCIKPTRDKLAFGMWFIPYLGVLDVNTGAVTGIRMDKYPGLDPDKRYCHFMDLECDDEFIYALYCGGEGDMQASTDLFIFDWDCDLLGKVRILGAHRICLNGDRLYLLNYATAKAYSLGVDEIKKTVHK